MAAYDAIKEAIQEEIGPNNVGYITGAVLQRVLLSMVNALGDNSQYAGLATPSTAPGQPDGKIFYLAISPGVYVNFGGLQLVNQEIAFLVWDGAAWSKNSFSVDSERYNISYYPLPSLSKDRCQWKVNGYDGHLLDTSKYRLCVMRKYKRSWRIPMLGAIRGSTGAWNLANTYFKVTAFIQGAQVAAIPTNKTRTSHFKRGVAIFKYDSITDKWYRISNIVYLEHSFQTLPMKHVLTRLGIARGRFTQVTAPRLLKVGQEN